MINVKLNIWIPSDGYKYISNGTCFAESIHLGAKDNIKNWHDTNDESPTPEEEPNNEDYKTALQILLGVEDGDL